MLIVGPEIPEALRPLMQSVVDELTGLRQPQAPQPVFAADALPPAKDYRECSLFYRPLKVFAVSDGAAWIRQDTGVAI